MTDAADEGTSEWEQFRRALQSESRFGLELGLERIERALQLQGHPERAVPAIVVAGTNGKGETAALIEGVLGAHGRRTGLFTSPHLLDLRERFRVDGNPLDRGRVAEVGNRILRRFGRSAPADRRLTYFELTALIAAELFARASVDVAVYEVGLGGRLDAVNAIRSSLSVVTTIGDDHADLLGPTIEDIAEEKAAILSPDSPAIIGRQMHPGARQVLAEAEAGEKRRYGVDFEAPAAVGGSESPATRQWNAAAAVEGARLFLGGAYDEETALRGIDAIRWPGRMDRFEVDGRELGLDDETVDLLVDAAHNADAVRRLFEYLDRRNPEIAAVVVGGLDDKPLDELCRPLDERDVPVYGAVLRADRGADAERIKRALPERVDSVEPTARALRSAASRAVDEEGIVLAYGSTYLVGEVFRATGVEDRALSIRRDTATASGFDFHREVDGVE